MRGREGKIFGKGKERENEEINIFSLSVYKLLNFFCLPFFTPTQKTLERKLWERKRKRKKERKERDAEIYIERERQRKAWKNRAQAKLRTRPKHFF